jgi:hypothetical protein
MRVKSIVIKKSISLSAVVAGWADDLADDKGYGTNFSAYIADLIRRDQERKDELLFLKTVNSSKANPPTLASACDQIVATVGLAAHQGKSSPYRKK